MLVAVGTAGTSPAFAAEPAATDPAALVNPLVGTDVGDARINTLQGNGWGNGNTFPGAIMPFGMLQWSPDTTSRPPGGYAYGDNTIRGFSLTHLSGAGCPGFGEIPVMPFSGTVGTSPAQSPSSYWSTFRHGNEHAQAGTYQVGLDNGVQVDLAAALRGGVGRFTFPRGTDATLLFNTSDTANGSRPSDIHIVGDRTVTGSVQSGGFCGTPGTYTLHFTARFDRPFKSFGTWSGSRVDTVSRNATGKDSGGYVTFATGDRAQVQARIGISYVDDAGARRNLDADVAGRSYDATAAQAHEAWRRELGRIAVGGGRAQDRRTFYTALYHALLAPNVFSDADGRYRGYDGDVHIARGRQEYANFSGWDVYRSETQLLALLEPRRSGDMVQSMIDGAAQTGWLPKWPTANTYGDIMVGDPADAIIAEAYAFGVRNFDTKAALAAMVKGAEQPGTGPDGYVERSDLQQYLDHGYIPSGTGANAGTAATTLEYTTDDFAIAQFAGDIGDQAVARRFRERAGNWRRLLDPRTGMLTPRRADGTFVPFRDPQRMTGFVEGSQAQYAWAVPYDLAGLVAAAGGNEQATARLDRFFGKLNDGFRSHYAYMGNEPDFGTPWAYDAAGAPYKAQQVVRRIQRELFTPTPGGLVGNDDLGAMSAWYVWSSLGLFPETPGRPELAVNTPLFPSITVTRATGERIRIDAPGAAEAGYVHGLTVNGRSHERAWLPGNVAVHGGSLHFTLSDRPDTSWATGRDAAYPSWDGDSAGVVAAVEDTSAAPGAAAKSELKMSNLLGRPSTVRWKIDARQGVTVAPASGTLTLPAAGSATVKLSLRVDGKAAEGVRTLPLSLTAADGTALPTAPVRVTVARPGSLAGFFDDAGISDDGHEVQADYNDFGGSYSAEQLAAAGLRPGATVTVHGVPLTWPATHSGDLDNVIASGQMIPLPQAKTGATTLGFLGSSIGGPSQGTGTVTYTDGSTQQFTLGFGDWTLQGGSAQPLPGTEIVAKMDYRNYPGGPDHLSPYIFYAGVALDPHKTVASVRLPGDIEQHLLHVFSMGVG